MSKDKLNEAIEFFENENDKYRDELLEDFSYNILKDKTDLPFMDLLCLTDGELTEDIMGLEEFSRELFNKISEGFINVLKSFVDEVKDDD